MPPSEFPLAFVRGHTIVVWLCSHTRVRRLAHWPQWELLELKKGWSAEAILGSYPPITGWQRMSLEELQDALHGSLAD